MQNIKWLFFDLGSTLIDESECEEYRIRELLKQSNAPSREVLERQMKEYASQNLLPYKDAAKEFGLETTKWRHDLEKIYECVPYVLEKLCPKYNLGIIANQGLGAEDRLAGYGIRQYFDVIVSSAETGVSKPDLKIFDIALKKAECSPEEACMIGDRLDNDIVPAAKMGMYTIWVRQGSFKYGNVDLAENKPDIIVEQIVDILSYL